MLTAAEARGMKVVLGLYFHPSWGSSAFAYDQAGAYDNLLDINRKVIDELFARYGGRAGFGGWYIPQEIDDLNWQADTRRDLLATLFQGLAAHAKAKTPGQPVMIAPFFGYHQYADAYEAWWLNFLAQVPALDWIIPQDGMGVNDRQLDWDVAQYLRAVRNAAATCQRNFGVTVESFQPGANGSFVPTTASRLDNQLKVATKELAGRIFQFEWPFMQGSRGPEYQALYDGYRALGRVPAP
jgi:hypothetical protein